MPHEATIQRPIDMSYHRHKMALFEREFDAEAIQRLQGLLSGRFQPEVEVTFDDIRAKYPHYLKLLVDEPLLGEFADQYLSQLRPMLQSPFVLPGCRVTQGPWLGDYKLWHFPHCGVDEETVANKRVLDIGCNAGFDSFYLSTLGPCEVIGAEPAALFYSQALLFWSIYNCTNLRFVHTRWQNIHPEAFGSFDLINCQGILYHEPSPMLLLERIFSLLAPGGKLVLETHVTLDDDDKARYVEGAFWGDHNWFWIPSIQTTGAMLRSCGFERVEVRTHNPVPSKNPADSTRTVEGVPVGGRASFTAHRPKDGRVFRIKYGSDA